MDIVPELSGETEDRISLFSFMPDETILAVKDEDFLADAIERTYQEGFSQQAILERMEEAATELEQHEIEQQLRRESQLINGAQFRGDSERFRRISFGHQKGACSEKSVTFRFNITAQPLFHKNFDLLAQTLEDYVLKGYSLFILADSQKQNERLKDILAEKQHLDFVPVNKTLHEGFIDHDAKACFLTDHQIFDRFHKYNLKSDKARTGKVALTLKEIQQFEIGDYVVHVDHGIGKFGGLVRMPQGDGYQEMINITYQRVTAFMSLSIPCIKCRNISHRTVPRLLACQHWVQDSGSDLKNVQRNISRILPATLSNSMLSVAVRRGLLSVMTVTCSMSWRPRSSMKIRPTS